jgi:arabinose-5-phosphate isomerase
MDTDTARRSEAAAERLEEADFARRVFEVEAQALSALSVDASFHDAVELIVSRSGSVVVTGLGKSFLIGQKISATFASTGTSSHVLHPTDAVHGDLGRVRRNDTVVALSYGGQTEEVVGLVTILRQDDVPVIAVTARTDTHLARLATVTLAIGDVTEACPMNLAPTASTTAMLAMGDALALCVSRRRQFGVEDFQKVHPGGALGRTLMPITAALRLKAGDNLPLVRCGATVDEALRQVEQFAVGGRRAGAFIIVDNDGRLAGIFTDGDLRRRIIERRGDALLDTIDQVMVRRPKSLSHTSLVRDAVQLAREYRIDEIPVVDDDNRPIGLVDVQDLIALKVIDG